MKYKKFEEIVKNVLKQHPEVQSIAMTDSFFDKLRADSNRFSVVDFRRILGIPICCLPDGELDSFSPNKGKYKVDYKFVGMRIKWQ